MLRASLLSIALGSVVACGGGKAGKLSVDTPALPYKAPDIEELSGVPDDEETPTEETKPEAKPEPKAEVAPTAPSPVNATPAPVKPATPAKPPAKGGTPTAPAKK